MIARQNEFGALAGPYGELWLAHVARLDKRLQLLHTLKQGMEFLLLVCSYLFYYLIDCIAQIMSLPIIR
jgi:hypothetical protein